MKNDRRISILIIILVAIGVAIWHYTCVPYADDFVYRHKMINTNDPDFWEIAGERIKSVSDVVTSAINHYLGVNGRLPNIIMFFTILLPPWTIDIVHGIMVGLMLWLILLCSGAKPLPWMAATASLVMWKWFPWSDNMVSTAFMLNYPWACTAMLGYSYLFLTIKEKNSRYKQIAILLLSFCAGWMHEGFSIPIACASIIHLFVIPKKSRQIRMPMIAALILGTAICVFAPGTFARVDALDTGDFTTFAKGLIFKLYPLYIYTILLLVIYLAKDKKQVISELKANLFWIVTAVINTCIVVVFQAPPGRSLWPMHVAVLIMIFATIYRNFAWCRKAHTIIARALMIAICLFMYELIKWQIKVSDEQQYIIDCLEKTKAPDVYLDMTDNNDIPWWVFGIPCQYRDYQAACNTYVARSLSHCDVNNVLTIAPTRFNGVPFDEWERPAGNNRFRGEWPALYSRDSIADMNFELVFGKPEAAMSPIAKILTRLINTNRGQAADIKIRRCATSQGDTIYRYFFSVGREGRYREVTEINEIEK